MKSAFRGVMTRAVVRVPAWATRCSALIVLLLWTCEAAAQPALVATLSDSRYAQTPSRSGDGRPPTLDGIAYWMHGDSIVRSDGTAAGTYALFPWARSLPVRAPLGEHCVVGGGSLWCFQPSDPGAPRRVLENFMFSGRTPVVVGSRLVFEAKTTPATVEEIWSVDSTFGDPQLIRPWQNGYQQLMTFPGRVCAARLGELWCSDGTTAGSSQFPVPGLASVGSFAALPTALVITSGSSVLISDGTAAGTVPLTGGIAGGEGRGVLASGSVAYVLKDSFGAATLWSTDGTQAGTQLVASSSDASISSLRAMVGRHAICTGDYGYGLRSIDTQTGAVGAPLPEGFVARALVPVDGKLLIASSGATYATDGTAAGTVLIHSGLNSGLVSLASGALIVSRVAAAPATDDGVYWTDGTLAGTRLLMRTLGVDRPREVTATAAVGDRLWLQLPGMHELADATSLQALPTTAQGVADGQLWQMGNPIRIVTPAGLQPVANCPPLDEVGRYTFLDGGLVYIGAHPFYGRELFRAEAAGCRLLPEVATGYSGLESGLMFTPLDGVALLSRPSQVIRTDGTTAGTYALSGSCALAASLGEGFVCNSGPYLGFVDRSSVRLLAQSQDGFFIPKGLGGETLKTTSGLLFFLSAGTLWRTDGTATGTFSLGVQPATFSLPGRPGQIPGAVMGNLFVFDDGAGGLWKSDGTVAGTVLVRTLRTGGVAAQLRDYLAVDGLMFFTADDGADRALWRTDGTATGTLRLRSLAPSGTLLSWREATAMFSQGRVVFSAWTPEMGFEPMISDGTVAGTTVLADLRPGKAGSEPHSFTIAHDRLYFFASTGNERTALWSMPLASFDRTGPVIDAQVAGSASQGWYTSDVTVTWRVEDGQSDVSSSSGCGPVTLQQDTAGTTLTCTAASPGGTTTRSVVIRRDSTGPTLQCPSALMVDASDATGALVPFSVTATDAIDPMPAQTVTPAGGTRFPLGDSTVTATAQDAAGNSSACTFSVTVRDATPPELSCPADFVVEATSEEGSVVAFAVTARDSVDRHPLVTTTRVPGLFPLGETSVTGTAIDASGNSASCTFKVTVRDSTPPLLLCPQELVVEATSADGAVVKPPLIAALDFVDTAPVTSLEPSFVAPMPLGTTVVTASAADAAGNVRRCTFDVRVVDRTPPLLTCPADLSLTATDSLGASAQLASAQAVDAVDPAPRQEQSIAVGTVVPVGATAVRVTATDVAGNAAACVYLLNVREPVAMEPRDQAMGCAATGSGLPLSGAAIFLALAMLRSSRRSCRKSLGPGTRSGS